MSFIVYIRLKIVDHLFEARNVWKLMHVMNFIIVSLWISQFIVFLPFPFFCLNSFLPNNLFSWTHLDAYYVSYNIEIKNLIFPFIYMLI